MKKNVISYFLGQTKIALTGGLDQYRYDDGILYREEKHNKNNDI